MLFCVNNVILHGIIFNTRRPNIEMLPTPLNYA